MEANKQEYLLDISGLTVQYNTDDAVVHAVNGLNLKLRRGETVGLVGETGAGKTTLALSVLRLLPERVGEIVSGSIRYEGEDLLTLPEAEMLPLRGKRISMIFQDPYSSLDPRMSVRNLVAEPLEVCNTIKDKKELNDWVDHIMELCGLPLDHANLYPHELDGGLRQRVGLARAMALGPKFVVCDEPVSALDVSIQAQILNLLMDLQDQQGLSYMFITHDLCVVKHISDEIMVMYMGQTVEYAAAEEIFSNPLHPYTKALLQSIPTVDLSRRGRERFTLKGEVSNPIDPAPGCRFAPRCQYMCEKCKGECTLREVAPGHLVACALL